MKDFAKSIRTNNSLVRNISADITTDGNTWFVTTSDGKKKEFTSEREAEEYIKKIKTGNSKVGNAKWSILEVTNPNTPNDGKYVGTIEADTKYEAESKFKKENPNIENRVVAVKVKNSSVEEQNEKLFHSLEKDVEKKEEKNDEEIEEVGNAKDKNDKDIKVGDFVNVTGKKGKVTKIISDDVVEVFFDNSGTYYPDRTDRYYANQCTKIGNSKVGNETYQHKLYPGKYVIIEGNNYKIITDGKVEKSGVLTDAVLYGINQTYKKVGNADSEEEVSKQEFIKVAKQKGWSEAQIKDFIKQIEREGSRRMGNSSEYEILKQDPSKMHPAYKKAYEEALKKLSKEDEEMKKRFEREYGVKAKNEASDDKFAYVMREFDEGKLKTPDGKVVTDPAQAKAIAYSESKKTENGLARARNAMACNKKVGNWNSERSIKPVSQYKDFIHDLKNAIMLEVAAITYNGVDEQTLKSWVEQAKKEGYASAIKGVQGKKVILDTY